MVLVPLAPRWKAPMPSNQLEVGGLVCWLVHKGFALACHNMEQTRCGSYTHYCCYQRHGNTTLLTGSTLPFSVTLFLSLSLTIALFGLMGNMKQHLLAEPNRYANLFHSRRFDKLDCSS